MLYNGLLIKLRRDVVSDLPVNIKDVSADELLELVDNKDSPIENEGMDWSKLDGEDWCSLLSRQPQFAEHCNWCDLTGDDWCALLINQPQLVAYFRESSLSVLDWCDILKRIPTLREHLK